MNEHQDLLLAKREIEEHCRAPAKCAHDHATQIGRILLKLQEHLTKDEVLLWCSNNTILTESAARNYMSNAQNKIESPFISMIAELGQAYKLLISEEERKSIEKIEEGTRSYLRKRSKVASEALSEIIKKYSGKFASTEKFMENWFEISDPAKDKQQEVLLIIIEDYLAHLADLNRRLEAIHTLITRLKAKGTDLQIIIAAKQ